MTINKINNILSEFDIETEQRRDILAAIECQAGTAFNIEPSYKAQPETAAAPYQWQPIATAPKDGTHILGSSKYGGYWEKNGRYCAVITWQKEAFSDGTGGWISIDTDEREATLYCGMTHWMPLPPQPKDTP